MLEERPVLSKPRKTQTGRGEGETRGGGEKRRGKILARFSKKNKKKRSCSRTSWQQLGRLNRTDATGTMYFFLKKGQEKKKVTNSGWPSGGESRKNLNFKKATGEDVEKKAPPTATSKFRLEKGRGGGGGVRGSSQARFGKLPAKNTNRRAVEKWRSVGWGGKKKEDKSSGHKKRKVNRSEKRGDPPPKL